MKNLPLTGLFLAISLKVLAQNVGINTKTPIKTFSVNGSIVVDQNSLNTGTLDSANITFGALPVSVGLSGLS